MIEIMRDIYTQDINQFGYAFDDGSNYGSPIALI